MPGGRQADFDRGDWRERLAETVFRAFAFTTRVRREDDVGHDLFCVLSRRKDRLLWAGSSFTVQVKSDLAPIVFSKPHELEWLHSLESPLFVAVVHQKEKRIDVYSTWRRLTAILGEAAESRTLVPEPIGAGYNAIEIDARGTQRIPLGPPVASIVLDDVFDDSRVEHIRSVLEPWIELDRNNIVRSRVGMYYVVGPRGHVTNEPVDPKSLAEFFYWNARNLPECLMNFGRSAAALRSVLRAGLGEDGEKQDAWARRISDLESALRAYSEFLTPVARSTLEKLGMSFEG